MNYGERYDSPLMRQTSESKEFVARVKFIANICVRHGIYKMRTTGHRSLLNYSKSYLAFFN